MNARVASERKIAARGEVARLETRCIAFAQMQRVNGESATQQSSVRPETARMQCEKCHFSSTHIGLINLWYVRKLEG